MFPGKLRKTWVITPVAAVLILLAAELWLSAEQEPQTFDESAHMYAGDSYWEPADIGGHPEHPLLGRLYAALPLLRLRLKVLPPTEIFLRGASLVEGTQFPYSQDADALLFRSRVAVKVFALFLLILVFVASAAIAAISVTVLWAFLGFHKLVADRRLVSERLVRSNRSGPILPVHQGGLL
jgi:hypothetical protein